MSQAMRRIVGMVFALCGLVASCATPGQESLEDLTKNEPPCSCTVGARRCRGGQVQVCEQQSATCSGWGPIIGCPGGVMCRDSESCDVDCSGKDLCAAGLSRCADEATSEICRIGASGCLEWSRQACPAKNYCDPRGQICFESKGAPGTQSAGNYPWFEVPGHKPRDFRVVAGHWSALGKFQGMGVFGVDTGCVWGGKLTALRIDADPEFLAVDSAQQRSNDADLHSQDDMGDRD